MELKILEDEKNRLKFEIKGEEHSFCNALRKELWDDKNTEMAGYFIEHALVSYPVFIVEAAKDPRKVIMDAIERLKKRNKELTEKFKKI